MSKQSVTSINVTRRVLGGALVACFILAVSKMGVMPILIATLIQGLVIGSVIASGTMALILGIGLVSNAVYPAAAKLQDNWHSTPCIDEVDADELQVQYLTQS